MKFSNGQWLTREGITVHSPTQAYDMVADNASLTVYAPCKHVNHRGSTLDGPLLTLRYTSPAAGIIRVQVTHFEGKANHGPSFSLAATAPDVTITHTADAATLISGDLGVRVHKEGGFAVDFIRAGERLTGSESRSLGYVCDQSGSTFVREQLSLGVGEYIYGLGERFTPFVKNGQSIDIWNEDGGTSTEQSYKNIPFYLSSRGYGVLVNHPERVSFEVGSERVSKVQFSVSGESLEYLVIAGASLKEVLGRYAELTGKPSLPPAWSFGLWLTTSFTTDYDEQTVTRFVQGMQDHRVPLHVFHFDCFWMKEYEWCNFTWDERVFPDPPGMLRRLHERGLRVSVWINPYIAQKSPLFREAADNGYLLRRANGDVWQWDMWQAGMGLVDFTNPAACTWFANHLRALMAMGVDAFKTDFGERIPLDVTWHDGSDPEKMHNYYGYLYNRVVFEALQSTRSTADAVLFARCASVGSQKFPVHWGGDCAANYESMAESLRGGLSLSLASFGFWSHDIGGFENTATADLYKRWAAFGLLSTHSRLHGNNSYRVPWLFDEEAVRVLRHFVEHKCRLMPYLYAMAVQAASTGVPVMRPMLLEFPDDPTCMHLDRQYMLGDSLLVAPVFDPRGDCTYYLPAGRWTHFLTGVEAQGGQWRHDRYDYFSLPYYVRQGSLIAVGANSQRPDYNYADDIVFHLFALDDGASAHAEVTDQSGRTTLTARATRESDRIDMTVHGQTCGWRLLLRGLHRGQVLAGQADCEVTALGLLLCVQPGEQSLAIGLQV